MATPIRPIPVVTGDDAVRFVEAAEAAERTPKYPDFISERVYAFSDATCWWYVYGKDVLIQKTT